MPRFVELFLALRYVKPKRNFVSMLTLLSVLGPIIGVAVLVVVTAVMSGAGKMISEKMLNTAPHFTLRDPHGQLIRNPHDIIDEIRKNPKFRASGTLEGAVLLQTRQQMPIEMLTKKLVGVIPEYEKDMSKITKNLEGTAELNDDEVMIGKSFADRMGFRVGDKLMVRSLAQLQKNLVVEEDGEMKMKEDPVLSLPKQLTIVGIFNTGYFPQEIAFFYTSLDTAKDVLSTGGGYNRVHSINVNVEDSFALEEPLKELQKMTKGRYNIMSWQQQNKQMYATIVAEKNMMFFLLFFIVLVSAFGIAGTLLTMAMQKTREIGVLKAMGATPGQVIRIFLILGGMIGTFATTVGVGLGQLIVTNRQSVADFLSWLKGAPIFPPELYHLTKIPADMTNTDLLSIYFGSILLCMLAALLPASFAAYTSPAKALKSEVMM